MSNIVLNWKYEETGDRVLDYIASVEFDSRDNIAEDLGMSIKTVGRHIARLKEEGLLVVLRYENNNFIYMVGNDAKMNWDKYQARHIAIHRMYDFDLDEVSEEESRELPLFKNEIEDANEDDGYHDCYKSEFIPEPKAKQTIYRTKELDCIVNKLIEEQLSKHK